MKRAIFALLFIGIFSTSDAQKLGVKKFGLHSVSLGYLSSEMFETTAPFGGEANIDFYRNDRFRASGGVAFRYTGTRIYSGIRNDAPNFYQESTNRFFEAQLSVGYEVMYHPLFQFYMFPTFRIGKHYGHAVFAPSHLSGEYGERNRRVWYRGGALVLKQYYGKDGRWKVYSAESLGWDYFHPYGVYLDADLRLGIQYTLPSSTNTGRVPDQKSLKLVK